MKWPSSFINKIACGDALEILKKMPNEVVQCCVTSPPYWGLRDYGVDGQLGLEKTPEKYTEKMTEIFKEVRRILRNDGTLWLNLGDTYIGGGRGFDSPKQMTNKGTEGIKNMIIKPQGKLKNKDLVGIPWRIAFALQKDGWYLRSDIIWNKPNPMPESVTDRPTKAHEYIFLLSKRAKYYYDADAIREQQKESSIERVKYDMGNFNKAKIADKSLVSCINPKTQKSIRQKTLDGIGRNKRSVWEVTTKPFPEAHFAVFPSKLIEPCILAGCPKGGIVLDPFMGSGTTALVAEQKGRHYIGIELNAEYIRIADRRLREVQKEMFT